MSYMEQHRRVQLNKCHIWSWMQPLSFSSLTFKSINIVQIKISFHNMGDLRRLLNPERDRVILRKPNHGILIKFRWQSCGKSFYLIKNILLTFLCLNYRQRICRRLKLPWITWKEKCLVFSYC